jgi:hypothetical protein
LSSGYRGDVLDVRVRKKREASNTILGTVFRYDFDLLNTSESYEF